jgi:hypothetical protein
MKELIVQLKILHNKSTHNKNTDISAWYAHSTEVRGPFHRWLTVLEVPHCYKDNVASVSDDAAYATASMNAIPKLIEYIEYLEKNKKGL